MTQAMAKRWVGLLLWGSMLFACTATNTGNPGNVEEPSGPSSNDDPDGSNGPKPPVKPEDPPPPEGVQLITAALERKPPAALVGDAQTRFVDDSQDFAFALYATLAPEPGNLIVSPYSIRAAFSLLYAGASDVTADELANTFFFGLDKPALFDGFNGVDLNLDGRSAAKPDDELQLSVVYGAFGSDQLEFQTPFLETIAQYYGTGMFAADFQHQPDPMRKAINAWVSEHTGGHIEDILPFGSIDPTTAFVLANAIYLKASWQNRFAAKHTISGSFHAPGGDVTAAFMHDARQAPYGAGDGYQALSLGYVDRFLSMLFILPDEGRFAELEAGFDGALLQEALGSLSTYEVTMSVPKFEFGSDVKLTDALMDMGLSRIFTKEADLEDMAKDPVSGSSVYVGDAFHKAYIAIDETGTEAAAATVIVGVIPPPTAPTFPTVQLDLDRPFLFVIYDELNRQPLFVGRVLDPSAH